MTATIYSTLTGKLVGKHPTLGLLVSSDGEVLCLNYGYRWGNPNAKFHWTVGYLNTKGYRYICFKKKNYFVHRLVAETFIPNTENKPTVDHINRDTTDNSLCNLRWADMQEQCRNTKSYDAALDLGVRYHDDPAEWSRRYALRNYNIKRQDPEWVEQNRTRSREYMREYMRKKRQDPEVRKKEAEKARKYRAKKKAEQSAQPSA